MTRTLSPNAATQRTHIAGIDRITAADTGSVLAGAAALAGLPLLGHWAWSALAAAPGCDGYTAMLLHAVVLFALVAGAVTALFGLACGLGGLLLGADRA